MDQATEQAKAVGVSLYESDREDVEAIRVARKLDSFSQAVRVAIREMADRVKQEKDEKEAAA